MKIKITVILLLVESLIQASAITFINDDTRMAALVDTYNGTIWCVAPQEVITADVGPRDFLAKIPYKAGLTKSRFVLYLETRPGSNKFDRYIRLTEKYNTDNERKNSFKISEIKQTGDRVKERFFVKKYNQKKSA